MKSQQTSSTVSVSAITLIMWLKLIPMRASSSTFGITTVFIPFFCFSFLSAHKDTNKRAKNKIIHYLFSFFNSLLLSGSASMPIDGTTDTVDTRDFELEGASF